MMMMMMVPFSVILSDPYSRFLGHGVIFRPMNALNVLCAQLTRNLFAIAKFLFNNGYYQRPLWHLERCNNRTVVFLRII